MHSQEIIVLPETQPVPPLGLIRFGRTLLLHSCYKGQLALFTCVIHVVTLRYPVIIIIHKKNQIGRRPQQHPICGNDVRRLRSATVKTQFHVSLWWTGTSILILGGHWTDLIPIQCSCLRQQAKQLLTNCTLQASRGFSATVQTK